MASRRLSQFQPPSGHCQFSCAGPPPLDAREDRMAVIQDAVANDAS